jgi:transketolase
LRDAFCSAIVRRAATSDMVFLTGDLGFQALEPVRDVLGDRFVNCGIAEQNMVTVAAAMAQRGLEVWVYSIGPFCYARAFEQIRNDVCLGRLPVNLVGNGGGYAYGVMGPTHHSIEDYGTLLGLPGMRVFVPAFDSDVDDMVTRMAAGGPAYLRLGRDELPAASRRPPSYAALRRLTIGNGPVVIACGPLAASALAVTETITGDKTPELWVVAELPLSEDSFPPELSRSIDRCGAVVVVEEHVTAGGLGAQLALLLLSAGIKIDRFRHLHAKGYPSGRYGSQNFHRSESGLDADSLRAALEAVS